MDLGWLDEDADPGEGGDGEGSGEVPWDAARWRDDRDLEDEPAPSPRVPGYQREGNLRALHKNYTVIRGRACVLFRGGLDRVRAPPPARPPALFEDCASF